MGCVRAFRSTNIKIKPRPLLLAVLICPALFALWSWDLGDPSFSEDESFVARLATEPVSEDLRQLNSNEPHPLVYDLLMHVCYLFLGSHHEFLMRYPSLLIGMLLLSLTYRLDGTWALGGRQH